MTGRVEEFHALLPVVFRLPGRPDFTLEFVVDTGYTGTLSLPPESVASLDLPFAYDLPAVLADDSEIVVAVHAAVIVWNGAAQGTRVLAMGRRPLLGTALLSGSEFFAQFDEGGEVGISPL